MLAWEQEGESFFVILGAGFTQKGLEEGRNTGMFVPHRGSTTRCMGPGKHVRHTRERESAGFTPATQHRNQT